MNKHKHPCPNKGQMKEHACSDKSQCWEPCGELGNDARYARVAPPSTKRDHALKELRRH